LWAIANQAGTSLAAPLVSGAAALLIGERWQAFQEVGRGPTARGLRAILINEADETVAGMNPGLTSFSFGQGRLDAYRTATFFRRGGELLSNRVKTNDREWSGPLVAAVGQTVEITLTWNRVAFPQSNPNCTNLDLEVVRQGPTMTEQTVAISNDAGNNYERVRFTIGQPGLYRIKVRAVGAFVVDEQGKGKKVRFSLARFVQ
jgi:hypothetical protein